MDEMFNYCLQTIDAQISNNSAPEEASSKTDFVSILSEKEFDFLCHVFLPQFFFSIVSLFVGKGAKRKTTKRHG